MRTVTSPGDSGTGDSGTPCSALFMKRIHRQRDPCAVSLGPRLEAGQLSPPVLGANHVVSQGVVGLHADAQEILADPDPDRDGDPGRPDRTGARLGRDAVHLHAVLKEGRSDAGRRNLGFLYHDAAAAVVADGEIVAAAQEERFTRKKHDSRFPRHALEYCLAEAGIGLDQSRFTTSHCSSSSACWRPTSRSRRAGTNRSRWRSRCGCGRSCS